ncbi:MAG: transcription antitermination factor NusB [Candidatus Karelsulcia muelleri]
MYIEIQLLIKQILINNISDNWKIKNLSLIDKIILHLYICELLFFYIIPVKVIMNEYIEPNKVNYLLMELWKKF